MRNKSNSAIRNAPPDPYWRTSHTHTHTHILPVIISRKEKRNPSAKRKYAKTVRRRIESEWGEERRRLE